MAALLVRKKSSLCLVPDICRVSILFFQKCCLSPVYLSHMKKCGPILLRVVYSFPSLLSPRGTH